MSRKAIITISSYDRESLEILYNELISLSIEHDSYNSVSISDLYRNNYVESKFFVDLYDTNIYESIWFATYIHNNILMNNFKNKEKINYWFELEDE